MKIKYKLMAPIVLGILASTPLLAAPTDNPTTSYTTDSLQTMFDDFYPPAPGVRSFSPYAAATMGRLMVPIIWNSYYWTPGTNGSHQGLNSSYINVPDIYYKANPRIAIALVGGERHFITLDSDRKVWGWGEDPTGNSNVISYKEILSNAKQIAAGEWHSFILTVDGDVYALGAGDKGQRGDGILSKIRGNYWTPWKIALPEKIRLIGSAMNAGYAVANSGNIYVWGTNTHCQLGTASYSNCYGTEVISTPKQIVLSGIHGSKIIDIAGGRGYTSILMSNGDLYGLGEAAAIGKGVASESSPQNSAIPYRILSDIQSFCAGEALSVALTNNYDIYSWGRADTLQRGALNLYASTPAHRLPVGLKSGEYVNKLDCFPDRLYYTTNSGRLFGAGVGGFWGMGSFMPDADKDKPWPGIEMKDVTRDRDNLMITNGTHPI